MHHGEAPHKVVAQMHRELGTFKPVFVDCRRRDPTATRLCVLLYH